MAEILNGNGQSGSGALKFFPPAQWLTGYRARWLGPDFLAGLTLAAYAIPVSLAYAALAGLPPQTGLYCFLVGGLGYALFGSSRYLAVGPTSAISLVFGLTLGRLSGGDGDRLLLLATATTLLVGLLFVVAWMLRLSVIVNFISESILVGFKAGAALSIAVTQVPKLFGVKGGGDDFFERLWLLCGQMGQANLVVLAVGLVAILLLWAGEKWLPGIPVALGVVILALVAVVVAVLLLPVIWPGSADKGRTQPPAMPWEIATTGNGDSTVFGIAPGVSSMADAMRQLGGEPQLAIVIGKDDTRAVEAYFDSLSLGALTGKLILTAALDAATVEGMSQRATRTEYMASGSKRAQLSPADRELVERTPVGAIAFIPSVNLDEATVLQRFGTPRERLRSSEHTEHFLYPEKGLDLVLDSKGKELLQYVAPRDFARLRAPLLLLTRDKTDDK